MKTFLRKSIFAVAILPYQFATAIDNEWSCVGGFWQSPSEITNKPCNRLIDAGLQDTCINFGGEKRCWWTFVPSTIMKDDNADNTNGATLNDKFPLVIDMHGGGLTVQAQMETSGYFALAESQKFILVYPQGRNTLWATCGSDEKSCDEFKSKLNDVWDDIGFLTQLISNMVQATDTDLPWSNLLNPERVYMTGFSMGCMMAQRYALERSKVLAGFACHGGELNYIGEESTQTLDDYKNSYDLQPMPALLTIGTNDKSYFPLAEQDFINWSYWNSCPDADAKSEITTTLTLESGDKEGATSVDVNRTSSGPCSIDGLNIDTVIMKLMGVGHVPDPRVAGLSYEFLKSRTRPGALDELPSPVAPYDSSTKNSSTAAEVKVLSAIVNAGVIVCSTLLLAA